MKRVLLACVAALVLPSACKGTPPAPETPAAEGLPWSAPPIDRAVAVRDVRTNAPLSFDELLDELATADAVFLGETHIDETTHRVELAVYLGLLARRQNQVVLAMEMFERDAQPHLDSYLAGETDEATFLRHVRAWGNYRTGYRPMIERARADRLPVVASNFPGSLRMQMMRGAKEALANLEEDKRHLVPAEFFPNTPLYWKRVDNAIRGHQGMMGGPAAGGEPPAPDSDQRLYSTQSLWDNSMGESCALALDAHPGHQVLHVNGGFHSQYWDGTVHQFMLRRPQAKVLTVSILPTTNPGVANASGKPWADYVVFAEERAKDLNEGYWAVPVSREVRYSLHLPESATDDAPVPLLVWLGDDGLTPADGLDLWKARLGEEVAIAVIEAPHRETQEDLGEGGRWFWMDTFPADVGVAQTAVHRALAYLLRNYPIDPERICLAGEGTGATIVAGVSLRTGLDISCVALGPRKHAKLKDFPLPIPELRGDEPLPDSSLRVVASEVDREWWDDEIAAYRKIGFDAELLPVSEDAWEIEPAAEDLLRAALGTSPRVAPTGEGRAFVQVLGDTPRARHWARLRALRNAAESGIPTAVLAEAPADDSVNAVPSGVDPAAMTTGKGIPVCPGPFGGTTVLVLPEGADPAPWVALEENDPLAKRSRFHRVRIATLTGDRALPTVLEALQAKRRRNVLVVPAEFCADGITMRALARATRPFEDHMTLQWLPGLGGQ